MMDSEKGPLVQNAVINTYSSLPNVAVNDPDTSGGQPECNATKVARSAQDINNLEIKVYFIKKYFLQKFVIYLILYLKLHL